MPRPLQHVSGFEGALSSAGPGGVLQGSPVNDRLQPLQGQAEQAANRVHIVCCGFCMLSGCDMPPIFWFMRVASDSSCPCAEPSIPPSMKNSGRFPGFRSPLHFFFSVRSSVSAALRVSPQDWGYIYRLDHLGWWHAKSRKIEARTQLTSHTSASRRVHLPPNPEFEAVNGLPSVPASC